MCNLVIDKRSGQAAYAIVSASDFLGLGDSCYPVPWKALNYDTSMGGYVVDLDKPRLKEAPSYTSGEAPNWSDPTYARWIDDYYG